MIIEWSLSEIRVSDEVSWRMGLIISESSTASFWKSSCVSRVEKERGMEVSVERGERKWECR